ncbi:phosphopantetheine-binding protein [Streptosporangium saharense]|uniref:Bifunctional isochorismate lyase/aryl carrier protein n=1 Tax=Streptosporangium saharense TaxID=1706840 RepID=A0A7W7VMG0_9ACTN|nr:phosphopantetheine-binding protein [Streptosporangium saharense]MBB4915672.1 bifunctional isochorismate lyase/aryl carrier protein [Streptosporangium saharense]
MSLTHERVREDVADVLSEQPAEISDDENLLDRGLDSIRVMSLVERWRAAGVNTTFIELAERPTVTAWWQLISDRMKENDR